MCMRKKVIIISSIIGIILMFGLYFHYIDSARVRNGVEPKFTIKIISEDGNKVTYWGLGYKVIRYTRVSPSEPFKNNEGVKYGSWFMNYKLKDNINLTDINGLWIAKGTVYPIIENEENIKEVSNKAKNSTYYIILNDNNTFYAIFEEIIDEGTFYLMEENRIFLDFESDDNIDTGCEIGENKELYCNLYASKFEKMK